MKFGTSGLESSFIQIQPIDGDSLAAPAFEPPHSTDVSKGAIQMLKSVKGITYLGFIFKEGVILASHPSMSPETSLAPNIVEINSHAWHNDRRSCRRSLSERVMKQCSLDAGWESEMGPLLFLVDNDEEGCLSGFRFCIRSGSYYIFKALEVMEDRYNMSVYEAASFALWTIQLAAFEDGASDGFASVYYVGPNGWRNMFGDDDMKCFVCRPSMKTEDQIMAEEDTVDQEMSEAELRCRTLNTWVC